ncbi:MAG: hypothetical protein H8J66_15995 [Nitrospira sp.]|nr:hypothetical protein [Nitrospira sp.]
MDKPVHQQPNHAAQPLYVTLMLDETGSMQSCKGAALAGFNHYFVFPARVGMDRGDTA